MTAMAKIRFDMFAAGVLGTCVAALYGAALPSAVSLWTGGPARGTIASGVTGGMPAAPTARLFDMVPAKAVPPARGLVPDGSMDVAAVDRLYADLDYALPAIAEEGRSVPRVFLAKVPHGLHQMADVDAKKSVFLRTLLPLVLRVNEEIQADRARIEEIAARRAEGRSRPLDERWLRDMATLYGLKDVSLSKLLQRVDVVPPSLALAQAAEESGWGTSRFARQGNALFGQWTWDADSALVPKNRKLGATHGVKAFPSLLQAVRAYARNLNTHRAYGEFRKARAIQRRTVAALDGRRLAATLTRYSERGGDYVKTLYVIMDANALDALDDATLAPHPIELAGLQGWDHLLP
jgi:Bax protein